MKQKKFASNENISIDLFQNRWLNYLSRTHILVPIGMVWLFAAWLLYHSGETAGFALSQTLGWFGAGVFLFTLAEYLLHRNFYHLEPTSERRKKLAYAIHGVHHDYPKDKSRLAMPPLGVILYLIVFYTLFRLAFGQYSYALLAGFSVGYTLYLTVHYSVHAFRPPNNFLKVLWTNHAIHHYQDDTVMYGVSSPLWDYVFGTVPKKKKTTKIQVEAKSDE
jgi:4-hydroxysphinganine ceramide fatty acyl 2-hydroxylase